MCRVPVVKGLPKPLLSCLWRDSTAPRTFATLGLIPGRDSSRRTSIMLPARHASHKASCKTQRRRKASVNTCRGLWPELPNNGNGQRSLSQGCYEPSPTRAQAAKPLTNVQQQP